MKFRKKSVVIDAEHFFASKKPWPKGVYDDGEHFKNVSRETVRYYSIDTLEGKHDVIDGDWIITGVKGEKYPCKPDVFEMTYEKVEE